jgi:hypothetical protein
MRGETVFEINLEIGDIYNVLMSVLHLIMGDDFPRDKAKECAEHFGVELDIYGIRGKSGSASRV